MLCLMTDDDCSRHSSRESRGAWRGTIIAVVVLPLEYFCQYHLVGIVKIAKAHSRLSVWRVIVRRSDLTSLFSFDFLFRFFISHICFCISSGQVGGEMGRYMK